MKKLNLIILLISLCSLGKSQTPSNANPCTSIPIPVYHITWDDWAYYNFRNNDAFLSNVPIPSCAPAFSSHDVWFHFFAPANGKIDVFVPFDNVFNPVISVYSGNCNSLTEIACMDEDGAYYPQARILNLPVTPGNWYYVRVMSAGTYYTGNFRLAVRTSLPVSNIDEIENEEINVFPNPLNLGQDIYIENKGGELELLNISIFDLNGKKHPVLGTKHNSKISISTKELSPGIYFLSVIYNKKKTIKKIIIT